MLTRALTRRSRATRARALAARFPVLANRNFRLLLADRLMAPLAATFSLVGVSFAVLAATGSTADLSYVIAAQAAPALVFLLVGGVIADRIAPQLVIVAANVMVAVGEGLFGILVLTSHPAIWVMIVLELVTGTGIALFYPASMALLPRLVPAGQMQEASAISRLTMNAAMMMGAALAGECVALFGAGWALAVCGIGMLTTVPLLLAIRVAPLKRPDTTAEAQRAPSMIRELREGWSEFRSHTWLWATVLQFTVVLTAWAGGFQVLGPAVANAHLGGAAAWGLISAAEATGLIVGGLISLRWTPSRPILYVVLIGAAIAVSPLSLAMLLPLWMICVTSFVLGVAIETMSVVWTVTMAAKIPAEKLARVSGYDGLGSMMGMPVGALVAGPLAAGIGVSATQYGAAAITVVASALALIPREVRTMRSGSVEDASAEPSVVEAQYEPVPAMLAEPALAGRSAR
ncbi:MAG TPA: MFS transporter [Streptosporangiaceae bacterium]|nr:MFS transporter [Streptosporangiaceae bacterium]